MLGSSYTIVLEPRIVPQKFLKISYKVHFECWCKEHWEWVMSWQKTRRVTCCHQYSTGTGCHLHSKQVPFFARTTCRKCTQSASKCTQQYCSFMTAILKDKRVQVWKWHQVWLERDARWVIWIDCLRNVERVFSRFSMDGAVTVGGKLKWPDSATDLWLQHTNSGTGINLDSEQQTVTKTCSGGSQRDLEPAVW